MACYASASATVTNWTSCQVALCSTQSPHSSSSRSHEEDWGSSSGSVMKMATVGCRK